MNVRHLSTHNTKGFFSGMKEGDQFTYPRHNYSPDRIRKMAARAGLKVADCENQNAGNLARGWTQCAVAAVENAEIKIKFENDGGQSDTEEAYLAAAHLMTLKLNTDEPAYRAAILIRHVLNKTLSTHFQSERVRMGDKFEYYYGAPVEKLAACAATLENMRNDPDGINAATIIANSAAGINSFLPHNFAHLLAAGIPGDIDEWCTGFRGAIARIDRIPLSDDLDIVRSGHDAPLKAGLRIVTARSERGPLEINYYASRDWHTCFSTYEEALLFGMFGNPHWRTVAMLYEAVRKSE